MEEQKEVFEEMKEKLTDLLNDVKAKGFWEYGTDRRTGETGGHDMTAEDIADYLLENGVTVQRNIRMPVRILHPGLAETGSGVMAELKPCPFCGGVSIIAEVNQVDKYFHLFCEECPAEMNLSFADALIGNGEIVSFREMQEIMKQMSEAWNRRTTVETNIYDKEETYPNCTVQVLTNTATGETSVGWWENGGKEDDG